MPGAGTACGRQGHARQGQVPFKNFSVPISAELFSGWKDKGVNVVITQNQAWHCVLCGPLKRTFKQPVSAFSCIQMVLGNVVDNQNPHTKSPQANECLMKPACTRDLGWHCHNGGMRRKPGEDGHSAGVTPQDVFGRPLPVMGRHRVTPVALITCLVHVNACGINHHHRGTVLVRPG